MPSPPPTQATFNPFGALDSDDEGDAPIATPTPASTTAASKGKANKSKPAPAAPVAKSDNRNDARPRRDGGGRGGGRGAGRGEGRGGGRGRYGDGGGERTGPERESYDDRRRDRG